MHTRWHLRLAQLSYTVARVIACCRLTRAWSPGGDARHISMAPAAAGSRIGPRTLAWGGLAPHGSRYAPPKRGRRSRTHARGWDSMRGRPAEPTSHKAHARDILGLSFTPRGLASYSRG